MVLVFYFTSIDIDFNFTKLALKLFFTIFELPQKTLYLLWLHQYLWKGLALLILS